MSEKLKVVLINIAQRSYALYLSAIEKIVAVVDIAPLPGGPEIVLGLINIEGEPIPVFDLRKRFGLPVREIELEDKLVIAQAANRRVALLVDEVVGVVEISRDEIVAPQTMLPALDQIEGIIMLGSNIVLINSLEKFLSVSEAQALAEALK
jgi:purine-binding chemotaxis protein CheW